MSGNPRTRVLREGRCTVVDVPEGCSPSRRVCVVGPLEERVPGLAYTVHERVNRTLGAEGLAPVAETHVVPSSPCCSGAWLHRCAVDAVAAGRHPASSSGFSAFGDPERPS